MGYLKYITNYYNRKINEYENIQVDKDTIIEAKELVKLMEDLLDEGYHEAYNNIENNFNGITRLKKYIENNNEKCFPIDISADKSNNFINGSYEINEYLNNLQLKNNLSTYKEHPLFMKLNEYCQWIKEKECAYVFLLRDTLLPYLAFQKERINNIYPLYFSRESLDLMTNKANLHGLFSDIIFDALDKEPKDLNELKKLIKEPITNVLNEYPQVKKYLMKFLSEIKEKKINVIPFSFMYS